VLVGFGISSPAGLSKGLRDQGASDLFGERGGHRGVAATADWSLYCTLSKSASVPILGMDASTSANERRRGFVTASWKMV
jgi:hypothetical protein